MDQASNVQSKEHPLLLRGRDGRDLPSVMMGRGRDLTLWDHPMAGLNASQKSCRVVSSGMRRGSASPPRYIWRYMMIEYKWVKFRTKHAAGPSEWDYIEAPFDASVSFDDQFESFLEDLEYRYSSHSEYWRGVEAFVVESVPEKFLKDELSRTLKTIKNESEYAQRIVKSLTFVGDNHE